MNIRIRESTKVTGYIEFQADTPKTVHIDSRVAVTWLYLDEHRLTITTRDKVRVNRNGSGLVGEETIWLRPVTKERKK